MLRLPNELLSRIADFAWDEDLPSMRLTCKHLEQMTRKHFIDASIKETKFSASVAGIQRLEKIVTNARFGPCVRRCLARLDQRALFGHAFHEGLLAMGRVFSGISHYKHDLEFGIICRSSTAFTTDGAKVAVALMIQAKPANVSLKPLLFDLTQLSRSDAKDLRD